MSAVSPVGLVGGELVRVSLLRRVIPTPLALGSVGLAALAQFVAQVLFVISGLPLVLPLIGSHRLRLGVMILATGLLVMLGCVFFLVWFRTGIPWIKRRLDRLRSYGDKWSLPKRWLTLGEQALRRLRARPADFLWSVGAAFLGWSVEVIETLLILWLLHQPVGWRQALSIEVLAVTIDGALFFVPAKMGTQEGGKVLIFLAMGLEPSKGLALGVIRRFRELAWAVVGLAILGRAQRPLSK